MWTRAGSWRRRLLGERDTCGESVVYSELSLCDDGQPTCDLLGHPSLHQHRHRRPHRRLYRQRHRPRRPHRRRMRCSRACPRRWAPPFHRCDGIKCIDGVLTSDPVDGTCQSPTASICRSTNFATDPYLQVDMGGTFGHTLSRSTTMSLHAALDGSTLSGLCERHRRRLQLRRHASTISRPMALRLHRVQWHRAVRHCAYPARAAPS